MKDETYMSNRVTIGVTVASAFVIGSAVGFQLLKASNQKEHNVECRIISILYLIVITSYVYKIYHLHDKGTVVMTTTVPFLLY